MKKLNILIGISGSIAAFKSVLLARQLQKNGHRCKVVITNGGKLFTTPELFAGIGCDAYTDDGIKLTSAADAMLHINLAKWADKIIVAPASANTLAKLANGLASDLLSQIILVANPNKCILAPAMNLQMWNNPITIINVTRLAEAGFTICYPGNGVQACGDIGDGRMIEPNALAEVIENEFYCTDELNGKTILLTLGATIEPIDPVRYISNYSSGKMGVAIIYELLLRGANVVAIKGKISTILPPHAKLKTIEALTADLMLEQVLKESEKADAFIAGAAVCDYKVAKVANQKIKKEQQTISLELIKNPDILASCKQAFPNLKCIGFAAETENLIKNATAKLQRKNLDMIIANDVAENKVFNQDNTQFSIIDAKLNIKSYPLQSKEQAAKTIVERLRLLLCD